MKALDVIIERENLFRKYSKQEPVTYPLKRDDVKDLMETIECALSPENLHCDGEISRTEANRKYKQLMSAWKQLQSHDHWNLVGEPYV